MKYCQKAKKKLNKKSILILALLSSFTTKRGGQIHRTILVSRVFMRASFSESWLVVCLFRKITDTFPGCSFSRALHPHMVKVSRTGLCHSEEREAK